VERILKERLTAHDVHIESLNKNTPEDKYYAGNLGNVISEDVITKMMSEYRHKSRTNWFTEIKTVKKVLEALDDPTNKHPG